MKSMLLKLWKDEEGPTAVEYAIMVALIAAVVIGGATLLGTNTNTTLTSVAGKLPNS
jgi:pilus assembly protein Flp/PilA